MLRSDGLPEITRLLLLALVPAPMIVLLATAVPPPEIAMLLPEPFEPMIRLLPLVRLPPLIVRLLLEALAPSPITVLLVTFKLPGAVITRLLLEELVPMIRLPAPCPVLVRFAVPPLLMTTALLVVGTTPLLQFAGLFQLPLVAVKLFSTGW